MMALGPARRADYAGLPVGDLTAERCAAPENCVPYRGGDGSMAWWWRCRCGRLVLATRGHLAALERSRVRNRSSLPIACWVCVGVEMRALGMVDRRPGRRRGKRDGHTMLRIAAPETGNTETRYP